MVDVETTFVLVPFFYHAYFPSYKNYTHRYSNPGQARRVFTFLTYFPGLKEQAGQFWCKLVYPFSSYKRTHSFVFIKIYNVARTG
jgi:hypothetical protein